MDLTTSEFGSTSAVVRRAQRLCAPADKEGEDPTAPADPDHLTGYSARAQIPFGGRRDQVVVNQFGTLTVDLTRPTFLFVPTGKSTSGPPASYTPAIDHFQCFRTVHARFTRSGIGVEDQFGTRTVNVRRPTRLCVPVDKDGSGITDPSASLMCYRVSGRPRINDTHVFTSNQFGTDEYDVGVVRELCLPSQLNPGGRRPPRRDRDAGTDRGRDAGGDRDRDARADRNRDAGGDRDRDARTDRDRDAGGDRDRDARTDRDRDAGGDRDRDARTDRNRDAGGDRDRDAQSDAQPYARVRRRVHRCRRGLR